MPEPRDEDAWDQLCDDVHHDLAARVGAYDGSMLVKYMAVVEALGDDGERGLYLLGSKDLKPWETLGMIEHVRHIEQAATVRSESDG